jgi:DNA-binding NarL/FixJ family response regulator
MTETPLFIVFPTSMSFPSGNAVRRFMTGGMTNREICDRRGMSADAAKRHVSHILAKLDVVTRFRACPLFARSPSRLRAAVAS